MAAVTDFDHAPTTAAAQLANKKRLAAGRARVERNVAQVLAIAIVILAWQAVVWSHWRPEYLIPSPFTVLDALWHDRGAMSASAWVTLQRGIQGFILAVIIGGIVGLSVARVPILRAAIGSMITGLQTMPSVAWVPLAVIIFRQGTGTVLFVVILGAAPSIANGIINGIDNVPPLLLRAGRVLGARGLSSLWHVVIPAALPSVIGGLKQGWSFAWRSLLAAELIAQLPGHLGIGQQLNFAQARAEYIAMFEAMIVILLIGILVDSLVFGTSERWLRRRYGLVDAAA